MTLEIKEPISPFLEVASIKVFDIHVKNSIGKVKNHKVEQI